MLFTIAWGWLAVLLLMTISVLPTVIDAKTICQPVLWPTASWQGQGIEQLDTSLSTLLVRHVNKALLDRAPPVRHLTSSGVLDQTSSSFVATRNAFNSADALGVIALYYALSGKHFYLTIARQRLLQWAEINQPNGNPIDTSRISAVFWAYDLVHCQLNEQDKRTILNWIALNDAKLRAYPLGRLTRVNNYRTHQLKMLLIFDKLLDHPVQFAQDRDAAMEHAQVNLANKEGKSIDYLQRDALYYQNFDLQPWIEIALLTDCCKAPIKRAYYFLYHRIKQGKIAGEFSHSTTTFDRKRANAGFTYAKTGGKFNIAHFIPTMVAFYTLENQPMSPYDKALMTQGNSSFSLLFLLIRQALWSKP